MKLHKWSLLFSCSFFYINVLAFSNTLVYPISLHYFKGQYYIADRGRGVLLSFKNNSPHAITKNNAFTVPLDLSDDRDNSILLLDPGYCNIRAFNLETLTFTDFSSPKKGQGCPRFLTHKTNQAYAYTSQTGFTEINNHGIQTTHSQLPEVNPYGIALFKTKSNASAFAIANPAHRIIYVLKNQTLSPMPPLCHGRQIRFPYDIVSLKNKLYIDDVILNALFEYDPLTGQCVRLPYDFIKPMGLTVAGDKIGIIDAGKRALIEYTPKTKQFKTLYQDKTPIKGLLSPWDFYVTDKAVYVSDSKRGGILKITKSVPHKMTVLSDAAHGQGPPFFTVYDIASDASSDSFYVSDATSTMILKVDKKTGNRTVFSDSDSNKGPKLGDATTMTDYKHILYVADWSNSAVLKIDVLGNRQQLVKLDSPPFAISNVSNGHVYVTQLKRHSISRINIKTGKSDRLKLNCPNLGMPFALVAWDKNNLMVTDQTNSSIVRITLKDMRCHKLASVRTPKNHTLWLMRRYDKNQLIVGISNQPSLYLVNVNTGKVSRFI